MTCQHVFIQPNGTYFLGFDHHPGCEIPCLDKERTRSIRWIGGGNFVGSCEENISDSMSGSCSPLGDAGVAAVAKALANSRLTGLDLDNNRVGPEGAKAVATALPQSQVTSLSLRLNDVGPNGVMAIANALARSHLTQLDLFFNKVGDDGATALAAALPGSKLAKLNLQLASVSDAGAIALANAFKTSSIMELDLRHNSLGKRGVQALEDAQSESRKILYSTRSEAGQEEIAEALQRSRATSVVDIQCQHARGLVMATIIAEVLPKSSFIELSILSCGCMGTR